MTVGTNSYSCTLPLRIISPNIFPHSVPSQPDDHMISYKNFLRLPTGLFFDPLILPPPESEGEYKCVNDIQNRRRKMKKHKRRKWRKKFASLIRKFQMQRERKAEHKLQELLELWRRRTEAWDPAAKVEQRLMFARRSGYYDSTKPKSETCNPVSDTVEGQKALLEATSIIRDLTLALNRVYENIRDVQGTRRLNADLSKNFKERVETFQHCRNTVKKTFNTVSEACSLFGIDNPEDIIPYVDAPEVSANSSINNENALQLKVEREILLKKIAEVDSELLRYREVLTSALWELNDSMYPVSK
ncbi:hypothetical protein EGR_05619 [Echinococcus granulosus]|uniref:Uncharacterized protein n=2 Tax=Echinococcus granulosus TaxID=6210 RepID=W6V0Z4_ECHGR|nr:hypothetical protein EGR_05619 [Echinococcus granulosus]EUB59469.1 hypothetical protein EGR_05619 [Echinococcus granulosus]